MPMITECGRRFHAAVSRIAGTATPSAVRAARQIATVMESVDAPAPDLSAVPTSGDMAPVNDLVRSAGVTLWESFCKGDMSLDQLFGKLRQLVAAQKQTDAVLAGIDQAERLLAGPPR